MVAESRGVDGECLHGGKIAERTDQDSVSRSVQSFGDGKRIRRMAMSRAVTVPNVEIEMPQCTFMCLETLADRAVERTVTGLNTKRQDVRATEFLCLTKVFKGVRDTKSFNGVVGGKERLVEGERSDVRRIKP